MTSYPAQYFGSATTIVNQTNVGPNTLSAQISSGGGGGSNISSFNTASISSLVVSSINGAPPGGSNISSFNTASISSLNVSSINGATPGGSIGPNPNLSSITFPNSIGNSNIGIIFNTALQLNGQNSSNASDYFFVVNQPEPYLNTSTNAFQINAPTGVGAVMSFEAGNNSTAMILVQDTTNVLQPLEVVASALNTSTINVNALNNQKAPQNVQFSSISISGNLADAFAVDGTQNWFQSVGGMGILNVSMPISSLLGGSAPLFKLNTLEPPIPGVFIPTSVDVKTNSIAGNYSTSNWEYINGNAITWSNFTSTGTISTIAISVIGYSQIF